MLRRRGAGKTNTGGLQIGRYTPIHLAFILVAAAMPVGVYAQIAEQTTKLFTEAEGLYARGDYVNASNLFIDVATAAAKQDLNLARRALGRAGESVCLAQLEGARSSMKNGLAQRAEASLDAALANKHCARFSDHLQWAREQKARLASQGAKRQKADRPK
jgi:hypothetical protein